MCIRDRVSINIGQSLLLVGHRVPREEKNNLEAVFGAVKAIDASIDSLIYIKESMDARDTTPHPVRMTCSFGTLLKHWQKGANSILARLGASWKFMVRHGASFSDSARWHAWHACRAIYETLISFHTVPFRSYTVYV